MGESPAEAAHTINHLSEIAPGVACFLFPTVGHATLREFQ